MTDEELEWQEEQKEKEALRDWYREIERTGGEPDFDDFE